MDRKDIVAKKQQYIYPAVANYFTEPLPLERGEMQHVWDVEGKKYLDFFGGIVTVGVGHAFANPDRPSYNEPAARLANERTLAFFRKHLA